MDAFIEAIENNNFDIDSYITDTVDSVSSGSNIDPFSTTQAKVEANSIWQAKLTNFMDCDRERKHSKLPKDACGKLSSDFYNYTFSLFHNLDSNNRNFLDLQRCAHQNIYQPNQCIGEIKRCWKDLEMASKNNS